MKEKTFNKIFNIFILAGMAVAVVFATVLKAQFADSLALTLLLVSAFGSLMGVAASVTSANGKIITFLFGLLDVSIYGVICLINWQRGGSGLGNAILHFVYFVPMQFVGFVQWRRRKNGSEGAVRARRLSARQRLLVSGIFLVGCVAAYFIIARFDRSGAENFLKVAVILDVLPLMCNLIGQFLMSSAYMEQWIFWIGVNVFSIIMWSVTLRSGSGSDYALVYVIKYCFYLVNSLNGLRIWLDLSKVDGDSVEC